MEQKYTESKEGIRTMLTLYPVFSDNALFQASSVLTLRGKTDAGQALHAYIQKDDTVFAGGETVSEQDGSFSLTLPTPPGSFDRYTVTVTCGEETAVLHNVQFGELWIATGQSNMEMSNYQQPESRHMLDEIASWGIRVYQIEYRHEGEDVNHFSMTPEDDTPGKWYESSSSDGWEGVSACATAFVKRLAEVFAETGKKVPVGFLNVSWGGTPIFGWIPMDILTNDERAMQLFEKQGRLPFEEKFDSYRELNFQQPAVMYNRKIAPLRGLQARGLLWYQGENECAIEWSEHIYEHLLYLLYQEYAEIFAADPACFPMISVLLYPWSYGQSGETMRAYVNQAFVSAARREPEHFVICPIDDLPPVWAANLDNHPIHPAHKYRVGNRMAQLALANIYASSGQRAPATLDSYEIDGSSLLLHFSDVGTGLEIRGGHIDGLYIAGEDGLYMPAECEILSPDTMKVWHPYLLNPVHCAYDVSSFACGANLWAGAYPAAPFFTDHDNPDMLHIEAMPFLNPDLTRVWEIHTDAQGRLDIYYHPVWKPLFGSEVCQDDAFAETVCGLLHSVRISGDTNPIGACVSSSPYHRIMLDRYSAMEMDLYHRGTVSGYLEICYAPENDKTVTVKRVFEKTDGAPYTFTRYTVNLAELPA
ncbi:MAG: sialate O-acetylesterase, partial [Eubacteriales bacterium]